MYMWKNSVLRKMNVHVLNIIFLGILCFSNVLSQECQKRSYQSDSFVCVCNEMTCDTLLPLEKSGPGIVNIFETNKKDKRFFKSTLQERPRKSSESTINPELLEIEVITFHRAQSIIGFGGAFTDSAGINIASLPKKLQKLIIESYYGETGSQYNMGRIPMASTDFSTRLYSYDDYENDFDLAHFNLAEEDIKYKIPYIKQAKSVAKRDPILLFATPWSSPYWMKTNNNMTGDGTLKSDKKYYSTFAKYFIKFLQKYKEHGLHMWGLTISNQPTDGFKPNFPFQTLGFTNLTMKVFLVDYLAPALRKAGYSTKSINIILGDDQRTHLPDLVQPTLDDKLGKKFSSGIAFHWYLNKDSSPSVLDDIKKSHPDKFILSTEACNGPRTPNPVILGDWGRAQKYAEDIIQDLQHSTSGWIDWNLALDLQGGPNLVNNFVDAPVIINVTANEFYKQPMYYVLAHFSKFLPRNSVHVESKMNRNVEGVDVVSFLRPDNGLVVHVLNKNANAVSLSLKTGNNASIENEILAFSLKTYVWWPNKLINTEKLFPN